MDSVVEGFVFFALASGVMFFLWNAARRSSRRNQTALRGIVAGALGAAQVELETLAKTYNFACVSQSIPDAFGGFVAVMAPTSELIVRFSIVWRSPEICPEIVLEKDDRLMAPVERYRIHRTDAALDDAEKIILDYVQHHRP